MDIPTHPQPHAGLQVCCMCHNRYSRPLLEVWASGNWHPICRPCLSSIGLNVFGVFSRGPIVEPQLDDQLAML